MLQTCARKFLTLKAKSGFHVLEAFAVPDFAFRAIARLINIRSSTARTFLFIPQIRQANAAVHSAGSNE
jgi:hypothetical protein